MTVPITPATKAPSLLSVLHARESRTDFRQDWDAQYFPRPLVFQNHRPLPESDRNHLYSNPIFAPEAHSQLAHYPKVTRLKQRPAISVDERCSPFVAGSGQIGRNQAYPSRIESLLQNHHIPES
ncbi:MULTISPECIES: hypothetical protein [unclassified Rhizobium]|uniref:hypothetical protein n=1 Tax=unclassified Rhizobium TaxID=2613769 RepID=UPI0012E336DA|nr:MULTISPECIES: hypothetical protein [unclassified Rhizobium]